MNLGPPVPLSTLPSSGRLGFLGPVNLGAGRSIVMFEMAFPSFGRAGMLPSNVLKLNVVFHPRRVRNDQVAIEERMTLT